MKSQPSSLTEKLACYLHARPISRTDLEVAAVSVLDAVAGIVGARTSAAAYPVLRWGALQAITAERAAFVLGALSNILEMDGMHMRSATHPGTVVVPAALSVAMTHGDRTARVLEPIIRGVEATARIGGVCGSTHFKTFQATSTCGGFGAAVAACDLLSLTRAQTVSAMGNSGTNSGGLWQFLLDDAMSKQWHAGRAAQAGVAAAQLAAFGLTGPARILEGERGFVSKLCGADANLSALLAESDGWEIAKMSYKPWPSPRPTHASIDAALAAHASLGGREIMAVQVNTYQAAVELCNRQEILSDHDARFSIAYCVGAALTDGRIDFESFNAKARERIVPLARRVTVDASKSFTEGYPKATGAQIIVRLSDGDEKTCLVEYAKGDPCNPMSVDELVRKAVMLFELGEVRKPREFAQALLDVAAGGPFPFVELQRTLTSHVPQ